jgi:hypothetical protein
MDCRHRGRTFIGGYVKFFIFDNSIPVFMIGGRRNNMNEKKSWIVAQVKKMASSGDEVAGKVIPINQETKAGQKILNF